jgi:hypothetical protein
VGWLLFLQEQIKVVIITTSCCAFDVMLVSAVIRVTVGAGGAVHGFEVSEERTQLFNGWDVIPRLNLPMIIWLCSRAREGVKGGLSGTFPEKPT